ncbi:MAG: hypothetical protein AB4062_06430 [Crocosphaera sp.]
MPRISVKPKVSFGFNTIKPLRYIGFIGRRSLVGYRLKIDQP